MPRHNFSTCLLLVSLTLPALVLGACDKRSAEEKGRDFAEEKIGFVEGATKVLKEKSKTIGESAGKGIGDLVKGTGSGIKDAINPPVKVVVGSEMAESGIKILRAHEGKGTGSTRHIVAAAAFDKAYQGRLQLKAMDAEGAERARSKVTGNIGQAQGSTGDLTFEFTGELRLSKIAHYEISSLAAKSAVVADDLGGAGIKLSQLKEQGHRVTLYVQFEKPFTGQLQLRAQNSNAQEVGRSQPTAELTQAADSASHMVFTFGANTPMTDAGGFILHAVKAQPAK